MSSGGRLPVGVIGAMSEEIARLQAGLADARPVTAGPFSVHAGRLEGVDLLLGQCGIGKVNAAALTQLLLNLGAKCVIFTGVAGAVDSRLAVGDVVIGSRAVQHDVDVTALGYQPGEIPGTGLEFAADDELVALAEQAAAALPDIATYVGPIASGDSFVSSAAAAADIAQRFGALCAEMEGAACAQVCAGWGVPFVIVRSISDNADHSANVDFRSFTEVAAQRADTIVRGMLARL